MDPLEEKILRDIERGDEDDDVRHNDSGDDADSADEAASSEPSAGGPPVGAGRPGANTGVKGVLADYREAIRLTKERREAERQAFWEKANKNSMSLRGESNEDDDDDLDDLLGDDDFIASYAAKRVSEMKVGGSSLPRFGTLAKITEDSFVTIVEKTDARVPVIVHLFDGGSPSSLMVNRLLNDLAPAFPAARFTYGHVDDIYPTFDAIALPTLLVYRAGSLVATLVRVTDELGDTPTTKALQQLLYRERVLDDLLQGQS